MLNDAVLVVYKVLPFQDNSAFGQLNMCILTYVFVQMQSVFMCFQIIATFGPKHAKPIFMLSCYSSSGTCQYLKARWLG